MKELYLGVFLAGYELNSVITADKFPQKLLAHTMHSLPAQIEKTTEGGEKHRHYIVTA